MKAEIPEQLKADMPQTTWGKILTATPVVMAVIATMLAGLASSEMTKAQYDRSLAAQQQSKAGDQWSFFQAKRLRGSMQRSTLDILQSVAPGRPISAAVLSAALPEVKAALVDGVLPPLPVAGETDGNINAALEALDAGRPENEIAATLAKVKEETLASALLAARERVNAFDATLKPVNAGIDQLEQAQVASGIEATRDFTVARAHYTANRYDTEARLNQAIAVILELQVRKNNISAERHHARSQKFFFGMLAAQAAVIISTFSLAARKRSMLWSLSAIAGLTAVLFAVYVYLYV